MKGSNTVINVVGSNIKLLKGQTNNALSIKEKIDGICPCILCSKDVVSGPDDS